MRMSPINSVFQPDFVLFPPPLLGHMQTMTTESLGREMWNTLHHWPFPSPPKPINKLCPCLVSVQFCKHPHRLSFLPVFPTWKTTHIPLPFKSKGWNPGESSWAPAPLETNEWGAFAQAALSFNRAGTEDLPNVLCPTFPFKKTSPVFLKLHWNNLCPPMDHKNYTKAWKPIEVQVSVKAFISKPVFQWWALRPCLHWNVTCWKVGSEGLFYPFLSPEV